MYYIIKGKMVIKEKGDGGGGGGGSHTSPLQAAQLKPSLVHLLLPEQHNILRLPGIQEAAPTKKELQPRESKQHDQNPQSNAKQKMRVFLRL